MRRRNYPIGEIEIPVDYFSLNTEERHDICVGLLEVMLDTINKNVKPEFDRLTILDKLLESSIETNSEEEKYEICAVLKDIQQLINA